MFASKLLKILETLPTDADNGACIVIDTNEEKAIMKDNQSGILSRTNSEKEANSLVFPTKDFLDSTGYGSCKEKLACDTEDMDELWKVPELYESVEDDLNKALPNIITSRRYGNLFASDTKDSSQQWNTPEFECSMISDFIDEKRNESTVSHAPFTSGCKFFETDKKLYTDRRVKEYELPELIVCYKESDYNIVKNICIDESVSIADRIPQPGTYVSIPADEDQHSNTSESADTELSSAGGSKSSVEYENNEEEDAESPLPNSLKPTSRDEVNNDSDNDTYLEDLIMIFGSKGTAKWKYTTLPETDSSANVMVRPEESGSENSQQSNPVSDQSAQQPDQIPFEEAAAESQNAVNEANNSVPATDLFYNSELGTESIVFNFNSTKPALTSNMDQGVQNIPEPSLRLQATTNHKDGNNQMHFANSVDRSSNNVHGQSLEFQDAASHHGSKSFRELLLLDSQDHFADAGASFSALGPESGPIIYSGRISNSESIFLGSDSSTSSSGSFAFPILQSEWDSSPVKMGQEESRHFPKHRCWKQGILCCRF
ncbi:hypothetical protein HAX54_020619 [Datura stramonium]|uniref:Uncharacterized protein n=1 Tax=Datura stramonium TaxID=4076 RepID=A0ABS8UTU0_DATST|nr:hypothetical protein [Datura stramonium]